MSSTNLILKLHLNHGLNLNVHMFNLEDFITAILSLVCIAVSGRDI